MNNPEEKRTYISEHESGGGLLKRTGEIESHLHYVQKISGQRVNKAVGAEMPSAEQIGVKSEDESENHRFHGARDKRDREHKGENAVD